jgi:MoxR-like ATPase
LLEQAAEDHQAGASGDSMYVSDRRWKKAVKLLKASAFFNGRDSINPLDLLLLQDCLWNSPESYDLVKRVVKKFSLNHAFDQQEVEHQIDFCREELTDIQQEIDTKFRMKLSLEMSSGLIKKQVYQYSLTGVKGCQLGSAKDLVKLVLLQSEVSVTEVEKSDRYARWVYIPKNELERVIKEGGGDVYGYVNQNTTLCSIKFDTDSQNHLIIKDIANRSVLVSAVTTKSIDSSLFEKWSEKAQQAHAKLKQSELHFRQLRARFHDALPHNFIDPELPVAMEVTLQGLQQQLDISVVESANAAESLRHFGEYFV